MKATRICSVPSCGLVVRARGWCSTHYSRWQLTGEVRADEPRQDKSGGGTCSVEACERHHYGQGFCRLHWQRVRKFGEAGDATPLRGKASRETLEAQFWRRVEPTGCCWLWTGGTVRGYGVFAVQLSPLRHAQAHRFAYEALVGPIPTGLDLDHLCRIKRCVNPDHLQPVTTGENVRRAWRRQQHSTDLSAHNRGDSMNDKPTSITLTGDLHAAAEWVRAHGGSCTSPLAVETGVEDVWRVKTVNGVAIPRAGDLLVAVEGGIEHIDTGRCGTEGCEERGTVRVDMPESWYLMCPEHAAGSNR